MHNANHIFTRTRFGLDKGVWLTLLVMILISLALLGYKMADRPRCAPFEIISSGLSTGISHQYYTGSEIGFYVSTPGSNTVTWDFGDQTKEITGAYVRHTFMQEGTFRVSATLNGKCSNEMNVTLKKPAVVKANGPVAEEGLILGPDMPEAGKPVSYSSGVMASFYEWTVQDRSDYPAQNGKQASLAFKTPGMYVLLLKLHNPDKTSSKVINVTPAVQEKEPVFPKLAKPVTPVRPDRRDDGTPFPEQDGPVEVTGNDDASGTTTTIINDNEFVGMLKEVIKGTRNLQSFNKYLCNGGATRVLTNGKKWGTFEGFIEKIRDNKSYGINSVETIRDKGNCITLMRIMYERKGIINKALGRD